MRTGMTADRQNARPADSFLTFKSGDPAATRLAGGGISEIWMAIKVSCA
jgi:hypothetical protein